MIVSTHFTRKAAYTAAAAPFYAQQTLDIHHAPPARGPGGRFIKQEKAPENEIMAAHRVLSEHGAVYPCQIRVERTQGVFRRWAVTAR